MGALIVTLGLLAFLAVTDMIDSWCTLMQKHMKQCVKRPLYVTPVVFRAAGMDSNEEVTADLYQMSACEVFFWCCHVRIQIPINYLNIWN